MRTHQSEHGRPRAVTGVFLDLGGTLLSYARRDMLAAAFEAALRRLGVDPHAPHVLSARITAGDAVQREYAARVSFLHADLFRDRLVRTADALGVTVPPAELERFDAEQERSILEHLLPKPDAVDTLVALRDRGVYCAVVSNADDSWLGPVLHRHGLAPLLDDWTSSEEAASCKPDAGIFHVALGKAGLGAPDVLFVGDSLEHDVAGAHAVGMRTVHVAGPIETPLTTGLTVTAEPDHVVHDLVELVAIVDGLGSGA
jgi:HAD superfamily hydrolase (TIGR01509 family)